MSLKPCSRCGSTENPKTPAGDCFDVASCTRRQREAEAVVTPAPEVFFETMRDALLRIKSLSKTTHEIYRIADETLSVAWPQHKTTPRRPPSNLRMAQQRIIPNSAVKDWLAAMPAACKIYWEAKGCDGSGRIVIGGEGAQDYYTKCMGCTSCSKPPGPA